MVTHYKTRRDFVGDPERDRLAVYHGCQTDDARRLCAKWLAEWDAGLEVPSLRITAGGPVKEQVAQVMVAALVRRLNRHMPRTPQAFIAQADYLRLRLRGCGWDLTEGALGGVINWAYWLLREGPVEAIKRYPVISWQNVSSGREWPQDLEVMGKKHGQQTAAADAGAVRPRGGGHLLPMGRVQGSHAKTGR